MSAGIEEDEDEYERPMRQSSRRNSGRVVAHDRSRDGVRGNAGGGDSWVH